MLTGTTVVTLIIIANGNLYQNPTPIIIFITRYLFKMKKLENFYALFWILGLTLLIYAFFRVKQEIFRNRKPATEINKTNK